jgi:hypothetical protein
MSLSTKYCRSLHAHISLGTTSDDRFMPKGYVKAFAGFDKLVLTEKLDGQNDCLKKDGVFARSHVAPTTHPWDKPIWDRWHLLKNDLGDLELFGENMYGAHSLGYKKLESFYYVFAVREKGRWLSWEEVKFYAAMLDFPTVPEIKITTKLSDIYDEKKDENIILREWFKANLGMTWEESTKTSGTLGGYDMNTGEDASEGFVVRNANGYETNSGLLPVKNNEFDSLFKLVRESHVGTDEHWTKNWKPATLVNYEKYKWYGHEHMYK